MFGSHQVSVLPIHKSSSIVFIIIASLSFINSYNGDFVFDDSEAIINNRDVRDATFYQIFQNDFWGTPLIQKHSHKSYRPLTTLSFRLHYWFRGELNPTDFHVFNIVLHCIFCVTTLFVFETILNWKEPQLSFYAAVLFSAHPIHAEAVSGIVGRADILCGLFMWFSLLLYSKCIQSKSFILKCNYILLCIINSFLAMLCKETGITILSICIIYDLIIINNILPVSLINVLKLKYSYEDTKKFLKLNLSLIVRCTVLVVAVFLLLTIRLSVMGFTKPKFKVADNPSSFLDNFFLRIINYNYIYFLNLWLLICPIWLCFDWSMGCVPLILGIDSRICFVIVLWLLFGSYILIIFSQKDHQLIRYSTISIAMLLIPFLPASNLFFNVGFVLAERILYIPSAGYCLLLVIGLKKLGSNMTYPKTLFPFFWTLLIIFCARSWNRSGQWKTEESLFQSGLNVCPLNAKIHYNVGKNAADRGMIDYAKVKYQDAITLNPDYPQAMNNLANLFKTEKAYKKAEELLRKAVYLQKDFAAAWMNLGIVLSAIKKYEEAEISYITAIKYRINYPDCYYNMGLLYLTNQKYEKAINCWKIATKQQPKHRQAWINMILLYDNLKKQEIAINEAMKALIYLPKDPSIHFNLGNILGKNKRFIEAEYHFQMAITQDPGISVYYTNLGVLYHRSSDYDKAEKMYKKALTIDPVSTLAKENLNKLLKKKDATEKTVF